jgi:hypothetical protein
MFRKECRAKTSGHAEENPEFAKRVCYSESANYFQATLVLRFVNPETCRERQISSNLEPDGFARMRMDTPIINLESDNY